jgi:uncharacterized protein
VFFRHVDEPMKVMANLLRRGADATGLRDWYAATDAHRARNDPCSCASGRKWKKCHGAPPQRGAFHSPVSVNPRSTGP